MAMRANHSPLFFRRRRNDWTIFTRSSGLLLGAVLLTGAVALCIIHNMNSKEIIRLPEADGWILRGVKGSHHVFTHPAKPGHVSVPHPKNALGKGLVSKLRKQAGI